jgi:hypothetical protein
METESRTDKGVGLAVLCSILTLGAAVLMYAAAPELGSALGFALAMWFSGMAVFVVHVYR